VTISVSLWDNSRAVQNQNATSGQHLYGSADRGRRTAEQEAGRRAAGWQQRQLIERTAQTNAESEASRLCALNEAVQRLADKQANYSPRRQSARCRSLRDKRHDHWLELELQRGRLRWEAIYALLV
jgi:hypothetical protein